MFESLLSLPPLSNDFAEPWVCDKLVVADALDKRISRLSIGQFLRFMSQFPEELRRKRHAVSAKEKNEEFIQSLCDLHVQLVKQGLNNVNFAARAREDDSYTFSVLEAMTKLSFRVLLKQCGLPPAFLEWYDQHDVAVGKCLLSVKCLLCGW